MGDKNLEEGGGGSTGVDFSWMGDEHSFSHEGFPRTFPYPPRYSSKNPGW